MTKCMTGERRAAVAAIIRALRLSSQEVLVPLTVLPEYVVFFLPE